VTLDLDQQGQESVVIDTDPERFRGVPEDRLAVVCDASDDDELLRCGIEQARGLVAATGSDATNTFITLTARSLNADLVIVARSNQPETARKLLKAGANHVISPSTIAGHRIATQLMHPSVVDFLDVVTHAGDEELWLEEVAVRAGGNLDGKTLVESNLQRSTGVNVLAVRRRGKQSVESESISDTRLEAGDVLIALGARDQLDAMRRVA
jgi:voltage-gated potassium channel